MNEINYRSIYQKILDIDTTNKNIVVKTLIYELQVLLIALKLFYKNNTFSKASDLAFSSLLALVPILSVLFVVFKVFGGKDIVETKVKPYIYDFVAPGVGKQISVYLDTFINSATIETLGTIGFIFLVISVFLILSSIENTFNIIWHVKQSRSIARKLRSYWLIVTISPILMTIYFSLTSYLSFNFFINDTLFEHFSYVLFFHLVPFVLVLGFFSLLIKVLPNMVVETKYALTGSIVGTLLYYLTKNVFIDYSKLAVSYNLIYGSISVLPMFMIWIYWFWLVILFSVHSTFVRQNFNNLRLRDNITEVNYFDKIKICFLVMTKMVSDYSESKEPESISTYASKLNIPFYLASGCFEHLEKSGIIKNASNKGDLYIPKIPLKEITVKKLLDSVNKCYLTDLNYNFVDKQEKIVNIVSEYKAFFSTINDESIDWGKERA